MKKIFDATKTIFLRVKILLPLLTLSILVGFIDFRIGVILSVFSFLAYGFVKLAIVRPIQLLHQAIDGREGKKNIKALLTPGRDEIEQLAETINNILNQLSESEENFRQMAESIHAVFWMTTPDQKNIVYISPAFENMWGIKLEELLKDPSLRFKAILSDDREIVESCYRENARKNFDVEYRIQRPDGKILWIHDRGYPVKDAKGEIIRITGMSTDISERKKSEDALIRSEAQNQQLIKDLEVANTKALQAARVKGDFLANMSHEIRTPMNGVMGTLELLSGTDLNQEQREYVTTATKSAEFLLEIINDVLDFSKIEAGKLNINPTIMNLMVVIEDVVEMLAMKAEEKGIELAFRYARNVPVNIIADPARIKQILVNLIGNAIKFTETGHVFINVEVDQINQGKGTFLISVEDTGIGIPEDRVESIFETFTQVDSSTSRKFGGTGLGLTICRQMAKMINGSIEVKSKLGVGSTFTFSVTVPLAKESVTFAESRSLKNLNIAVVDDNEGNQRILHELISAQGNRCEIFSSGQQAFGAIQRSWNGGDPIHMVLIDKKLPLMDGELLGRKIKSDPQLSQIELIMMVTMGDLANTQKLKLSGFSGHITKPIRPSQIINMLSQIWEKQGSIRTTMEPIPVNHEKNIDKNKDQINSAQVLFHSDVLLVEDTVINQQVAVRMLEKLGCRVEVANNGVEAVKKIKDYPYSLVFMDCQMPEMDGYQATQEIRKFERDAGCHLPIIAMTAHALEGDREKCLEFGMDDYISKPIKSAIFIKVLTQWNIHLDLEVIEGLAELNGNDNQFREKLMHDFLSDTAKRINSIKQSVIDKNFSQVRSLAHSIRGSAGTMGARRIYNLCSWIELASEVEGWDQKALKVVTGLENEFLSVEKTFKSFEEGKFIPKSERAA
ncbi:MAG: response regulator [Elusimicrobiota bacterium]